MAYGEQAALEGILARLRPQLAIEIGTYKSGSLSRISHYSGHVHTFDIASHVSQRLPNVTYHLGESATTVPRVLESLCDAGERVDFVLIDGDHSRHGVSRDVANVLAAPAVEEAAILLHDISNEGVRAGLRDAAAGHPHIRYANLSFVPAWDNTGLLEEAWGGLGILIVDREGAGTIWQHELRVDANFDWPTSVKRSLAWHAAKPVRDGRREAMYRLRPIVRRLRGSRGKRVG
jgi:hypothetical protein